MFKNRFVTPVLVFVVALPVFGAPKSIREVCSVYLGDFGTDDGSDLIREKMRVRLAASARFRILEKASDADAILTGAVATNRSVHSYQGTGGTSYHGNGVLRAVDPTTGQSLWTHEYKEAFDWNPLRRRSASGDVAAQMADDLVKAAGSSPCSANGSATRAVAPAKEKDFETGSSDDLKSTRKFCVITDNEDGTSQLVLALRDLMPEPTFTDSRTDCRTADAVLFYDAKESRGMVFIPERADAKARLVLDATAGMNQVLFISKFRDAWQKANASETK